MEGTEMVRVQVEVETITPLFLAGADPRGAPELRAASVRGALRYWLRALLGGALGDRDLSTLKEKEAEVFGSTNYASPVVVRVEGLPDGGKIQGYREVVRNRPGLAYLLFSARGDRQNPERSALSAGTRFSLALQVRAGVQSDKAISSLSKAYASLWLLTRLGGLGSRSRRGAGSLQVQEVKQLSKDLSLPDLLVRARTPRELRDELQEGLRQLRTLMGTAETRVRQPFPFSVLHPEACEIRVADRAYSRWEEALDAVGQVLQGVRKRREPDYSTVKAALQGHPLRQPVQRAAFGLPIVFYYSSLGGKRGTLQGRKHDRRASPLSFRVLQLASGDYALVSTCFRARLLEEGEDLILKRPGSKTSAPAPGLEALDAFWAEAERDSRVGPFLEVKGW